MKVFKRILLAGIVLVILLSLGAYFAIKIAFPPAKIKELVHQHGTEALHRDVSVEDVSIQVFPNLKLSVREVKVANAPGFSSDPLFQVRELALSIDFMSLLRFAPVVNEIKILDPAILYEVSAGGHNNLEGIGGTDSAAAPKDTSKAPLKMESPAALALKSFRIENGRVRYRDLKSGRELNLEQINQTVSLDVDQRLEDIKTKGKLEISGISVSDSASGLRKGNVKVTVRHDIRLNLPGEKLQVKALDLSFQDIEVGIKGEATHFMTKPPVIDFSISAPEIHLASVLKEIPNSLSPDIAKLSVKGDASLEAKIQGTLEEAKIPDITAHFKLKDVGISHKDLPAGIEALNMQLDMLGDTLNLAQLALTMGGNPISIDALITSLKDPIPFLQSLNINALVDLGKAMALAQKLGLAEKNMRTEGLIAALIKASGPLDPKAPENLKAQGQIDFKNVMAAAPAIPKPLHLNGQVKIDNEKITEVLNVKFGESDLNTSGTVTNYLAMALPKLAAGKTTKAKILVQSSFLNLDEILPTSPKKEEKESAPLTAFPSLPKVEAEVDIKLAKTQVMNLAMTAFTSHTTLLAGVINIVSKGSLYSGGFSSNLRADLHDSSNAAIALKLAVAKVEANDFISRLNDRLPATNKIMKSLANSDSTLYGKFNLKMDVKTHGLPATMADNLTGLINFSLLDGKLMKTGMVQGLSDALGKVSKSLAFQNFTFSNFTTELEAANGKLLVKDCKINESAVGSMAVTGSIGFDNSLALNMENHLPPSLSQGIAGATGALTSQLAKLTNIPALAGASLVPMDKTGHALLYFLIGGTLSRPSFSLDSKRMTGEASAGAKNALSDAFNKKKDELKAKFDTEKAKLEAEAKAKLDAEKKKLMDQAEAQKQKGVEEAKQQGKKLLKGFGL